jgi:molecular chaperone GrpE
MAMPHRIEDETIATEGTDVGTLVAENAALRDRLLRALADAENTRRRAERSIEETRKHAVAAFAREMLIVVDNLQRTIAAAEDQGRATTESAAAALVEGVRATLRVLMRILESFGVRPIAAFGERFDPSIHEAIMEVDDPSQPSGTVTLVVEDGYTINDRLLRPARVVVSKRAIGAASAPDEDKASIHDAN